MNKNKPLLRVEMRKVVISRKYTLPKRKFIKSDFIAKYGIINIF